MSGIDSGDRPHLLGIGDTEHQARVAAYAYLNHGHNDYDQEYLGGTLVNVSEELESLYRKDSWEEEVDDQGRLVGSCSTDDHMDLLNALNCLCIKNGELSSEMFAALGG